MTMLKAGLLALAIGGSLLTSGCDNSQSASQQEQEEGKGQAIPVEMLSITPRSENLTTELPGRISAVRVAEVRARVAGIVLHRHFEEGDMVRAGDLLFTIDPAPFRAALERAQSSVARAAAEVTKADALVRRYAPLVKADAISRQDYDDALAALQTARANKKSADAEVTTAQLDLGYAAVRAPISGRTGKSLVSEGGLVGQNETTPLVKIQQMDPVYADFRQPVSDVIKLRQALKNGTLSADTDGRSPVRVSVDGTEYQARGHLLFSDVTVDEGTGQIMLRGVIPNPEGLLMPGMYVRVTTDIGTDKKAIFVPQRAVSFGPDGTPYVMTVNAESKAELRNVHTGVMKAGEWQITQGLSAGDKIIVAGTDKIQPDTPVTAATQATAKSQ